MLAGDGGLGEEDGVPEAGVGAVDEEEIVAWLVRGTLGGGGDVDWEMLSSISFCWTD